VREIIKNIDLSKIQFSDANKFYTVESEPNLLIFYGLKPTHTTSLKAEVIYLAINFIKTFCISNKINAFSTNKLDGPTSLTGYPRIRTMFRHIFKATDIVVKIYIGHRSTINVRGETTNHL